MGINQPKIVEIPTFDIGEGSLSVIDGDQPFPFPINRVYYLYDIPKNIVRGSHAHKNLRQLIVAVSGQLEVTLDNGDSSQVFVLDSPTKGLLIYPGYWRTLSNFSTGAVALVLASATFDESDYIRDYEDFLTWKKNQQQ